MHAAHERARMGQQATENGDRERSADLAAGVEHPGRDASLPGSNGVEQDGYGRW